MRTNTTTSLIYSGADYFGSLVKAGLQRRRLSVSDSVCSYLVQLLNFYVDARNLHEPEYDESGKRNPQTLAEMWLTAQTADAQAQRELLKKLGDRSLYISGFFSESLNRSLVDVDYYYSMGASAYRSLATQTEKSKGHIFNEISDHFLELVDVFGSISQESFGKTDQGILRLYESYLRTGSSLAKERLQTLGVFTPNNGSLKKSS